MSRKSERSFLGGGAFANTRELSHLQDLLVLKENTGRCVYRDAGCAHHASNMEHRNPGRVIYIDRERTGVRIRVAVEEHSLVELAYSEGIPNFPRRIGSVVSHGEVIEFVAVEPRLDPLRSDPRFLELCRKLRFPV